MTKILLFILSVGLVFFIASCVDEFTDSQAPVFFDSPAVSDVSFVNDNDTIEDGTSTDVSVIVVDAPGGVDSVGILLEDVNGDPAGTASVTTPLTGQTSGELIVNYVADKPFAGNVDITITVFDQQEDPRDNTTLRKNSVPQTVTVNVFCQPPLVGTYDVLGEFLVDDFGSPDVNDVQDIISVDCDLTYQVEDMSGGLYTTTYATAYTTDPVIADIVLDPVTNLITWTGVGDQFGGDMLEDAANANGPSDYNPGTNTVTIYWTATAYGERGVSTFTLQ